MTLGEKIKSARKARGETLEEFCRKADITKSALFNIEGDVSSPKTTTLQKISDVLEIPVYVLLDEEVKTNDQDNHELTILRDLTDKSVSDSIKLLESLSSKNIENYALYQTLLIQYREIERLRTFKSLVGNLVDNFN